MVIFNTEYKSYKATRRALLSSSSSSVKWIKKEEISEYNTGDIETLEWIKSEENDKDLNK